MYCINCGVKLADSEKECPLCGTVVYHPQLKQGIGEELYPGKKYPVAPKRSFLLQSILTFLFLLPMGIVLLCDLQYNGRITWSDFVVGALLTGYVILVLPTWFLKPNPVVFVPCGFAAIGLYLLYVDLAVGGDWFLSFAFPVVGGIGVIVTAVVVLLKYVKRGKFFIFGGAVMATGAFMLLFEFLLTITFPKLSFVGWSFYPLIVLLLIGGLLIFLGIYPPARETMERKFFI